MGVFAMIMLETCCTFDTSVDGVNPTTIGDTTIYNIS